MIFTSNFQSYFFTTFSHPLVSRRQLCHAVFMAWLQKARIEDSPVNYYAYYDEGRILYSESRNNRQLGGIDGYKLGVLFVDDNLALILQVLKINFFPYYYYNLF